jgi:hypothetical protein
MDVMYTRGNIMLQIGTPVVIVNSSSTMFNTNGQAGVIHAVDGDRYFVVQVQGFWRMWFTADQLKAS